MNKNLTEIAYILDRSGSMNRMVKPAITGFNQFLAQQQEAPGEARLSLVLFNDRIRAPFLSTPLEEVTKLDRDSYIPRGGTALLDAIGTTVTHIGKRLANTPEAERPGQVVVAIFTDGRENSSRKYDRNQIARMIRHQQEKYSWKFLFLAANQDAIAEAAQLGIAPEDAGKVEFSEAGILASSLAISRKLNTLRNDAGPDGKRHGLDMSMQDLVDAEETPRV
ncbi:MAG: VWA domain-containing protein [Verrucomicrobiales bacterium]|nr:VWA domain-containing protein [Verrucomicrobiales bacterium]MDF2378183.1 VWA domain-containing protein [Verrucomicrobiales bacterium]